MIKSLRLLISSSALITHLHLLSQHCPIIPNTGTDRKHHQRPLVAYCIAVDPILVLSSNNPNCWKNTNVAPPDHSTAADARCQNLTLRRKILSPPLAASHILPPHPSRYVRRSLQLMRFQAATPRRKSLTTPIQLYRDINSFYSSLVHWICWTKKICLRGGQTARLNSCPRRF